MSVLFLTVCYSFLYDIMTWTTWLISKACMRLVAILELMQSGIKIWKLREKSLCVDCSAHTLYLCCTLSFCTRRVMMISTTASAKKKKSWTSSLRLRLCFSSTFLRIRPPFVSSNRRPPRPPGANKQTDRSRRISSSSKKTTSWPCVLFFFASTKK